MEEDEDEIAEEPTVVDVQDSEVPEETVTVKEITLAPPKYDVRPNLGEKFQGANVRNIISMTMHEQLLGREYRADLAPRWAMAIANTIRQRVQDLDMKRYKIVVQASIIEMKGAGVKCGQRCIWDPETDDYTDAQYRNESLFCYCTVYGLYMY